jgi:hypothetical protein
LKPCLLFSYFYPKEFGDGRGFDVTLSPTILSHTLQQKYTGMVETGEFWIYAKMKRILGISQDYSVYIPLRKGTIGDFLGFGRILSNLLKYT